MWGRMWSERLWLFSYRAHLEWHRLQHDRMIVTGSIKSYVARSFGTAYIFKLRWEVVVSGGWWRSSLVTLKYLEMKTGSVLSSILSLSRSLSLTIFVYILNEYLRFLSWNDVTKEIKPPVLSWHFFLQYSNQFILYSPISQIKNLPQRALQSVHIRHPSDLWPHIGSGKTPKK